MYNAYLLTGTTRTCRQHPFLSKFDAFFLVYSMTFCMYMCVISKLDNLDIYHLKRVSLLFTDNILIPSNGYCETMNVVNHSYLPVCWNTRGYPFCPLHPRAHTLSITDSLLLPASADPAPSPLLRFVC